MREECHYYRGKFLLFRECLPYSKRQKRLFGVDKALGEGTHLKKWQN